MKFRVHDHIPGEANASLDVPNAWEPDDRDLEELAKLRRTMESICQAALDARFLELEEEALNEIAPFERQALGALARELTGSNEDPAELPMTGEEIDQFSRSLIGGYKKAMVGDLVGPVLEATRVAVRETNEPFVRLDESLCPHETRLGTWLKDELEQVALRYDLPSQRLREFAALFGRKVVRDDEPARFPGGAIVALSPRATFERPRYRATTEAKWRETVRQKSEIINRYGRLQTFYAVWIDLLRQLAVARNEKRVEVLTTLEPVRGDQLPNDDVVSAMAQARAVSNFVFAGAIDGVDEHDRYSPYAGVVMGGSMEAGYFVEFEHAEQPVRPGAISREFADSVDKTNAILTASR